MTKCSIRSLRNTEIEKSWCGQHYLTQFQVNNNRACVMWQLQPEKTFKDYVFFFLNRKQNIIHTHLQNESVLWFRVNITLGTLEERMMLSGMHTVGDIFCCCCGQILGWKYVCSVHSSFVISIWDRYHVILIHFYLLRRRHTRRVRNTKKESSFLKGIFP